MNRFDSLDERYVRDMRNIARENGLRSVGSLFTAMEYHYRYFGYVGTKEQHIRFAKDIESGKYDKKSNKFNWLRMFNL